MKPCSVVFVSAALGVSEAEIMVAIRNEKLMATGGRSPKTAKVLPKDVAELFGVDIAELFGLKEA